MRGKFVPFFRRHAVQAKVTDIVDGAIERATPVPVCVRPDKGRQGWPHESGNHPRDAVCTIFALEQTVSFPLVLFQQVNPKEL